MAEPSDTTPELKTALPDQPLKKRVVEFDYYYDVRTFSWKLRKSIKQKGQKEHKYIIMIKRLTDWRGQYLRSILDIKSERLCNVLLEINKGVEDLQLSRREPEATEALMYYSYPKLVERLAVEQKQEEKDDLLIRDLQAGIFYVDEYLGNTMEDVKQMVAQREISFDTAWALFFPNTLVYSHHTNTDQDTVLIIRRSGYDLRESQITKQDTRRKVFTKYLEVVCDIIHDDGQEFGFARRVFEIDEYHGTRPIATLPVYPLQYHNDEHGVYSRAVDLGKRLVQLSTHSLREINGRAARWVDGDEVEPTFVNGRVMISPFAYARFNSTISPTVHRALKKDSLTDDQYAICSPILMGFAFDRKIWGEFPLTHARDVDWNDAAFDALVLGQKQKKLIHSLVRQHAKKEAGFDDIIKGKGQGLIGLLAGTPGCGKTLTAEAVAEVTHKPLYVLSAGELGITPTSLESTLVKVLELTQMWNAVLLLDEAEVFLAQRNFSDLGRNALVSIFLRRLEYYQGILILTTNMPKNCDHAFRSRIHFSVNYPELGFDSRKTIWAMFFKRNSTEVSDEDLCRLASYRINGRQIKNSFSSALTISQAEGSPSGTLLENIDVVLSVLNEWEEATQEGTRLDSEGDVP